MLLRHFKCGGPIGEIEQWRVGRVAPSMLGHGASLLRMENEIR